MERLLIESAIRALLMAIATGAVLWAMRIKAPAARHAAWACVLVLMLILPAWTMWGPKAAVPILPALPAETIAVAPREPAVAPAPDAVLLETSAPVAESRGVNWSGLLIGIYALISGALLLRLAVGTLRTHRLIRNATREGEHLVNAFCASPVTVGLLKPLVILPAYWKTWPDDQLDVVMTHEREHVRRRDPLVQWLALLNRAVFWFHPLSWWLERKLTALAEEACDAAVLTRGHNPQQYSEYLLNIARSVSSAGGRMKVIGLAMPGHYLSARIHKIAAGDLVPRVSRMRMASAITVGVLCSSIIAGATLERYQALSFEVASVKPTQSSGGLTGGCRGIDTNFDFPVPLGRCVLTAHRLNHLVMTAYGLRGMRNVITRVPGDPQWLTAERFDIEAKAENPTAVTESQLKEMLQTLLVDRFKLKVHRETTQAQGYAMVLIKDDSKLRQSTGEVKTPNNNSGRNDPAADREKEEVNASVGIFRINAQKMSMDMLAQQISLRMRVPVVDRTGLPGLYDLTLSWNDSLGPSLTTAVQEQLGLRLVSERLPVENIVIDYAEKPTTNEAPQGDARFEVESIKPNTESLPNNATGSISPLPGGRLTARAALLRFVIQTAYRVRPYQISGGPEWIHSARYDIEAKAEGNATPQQLTSML